MSMIASPRRETPRSVLCAGAAALVLAGLAACSANTSPTSAPLGRVSSARTRPPSAPLSGSASSAASAGTRGTSDWRSHPCALLTEAEASAAVGQRVRALENAPEGVCDYVPTDLSAGSGVLVIGPIAGPGGWRSCKLIVNNGSNPPVPVSGIGDEALWDAQVGDLCIRSGSNGLLVGISSPTIRQLSDHGLARAETLARLMLPLL